MTTMQQSDIKKLKALLEEYRQVVIDDGGTYADLTIESPLDCIDELVEYIEHDLKVNQP